MLFIYTLKPLLLLDPLLTFGIEKALKYLMLLFTNELKALFLFLKKLLVNIHQKTLVLLISGMLMKLLLKLLVKDIIFGL